MDCNAEMLQFCPHCGERLPRYIGTPHKFCPFCGQSLLAALEKNYLEKDCLKETGKQPSTVSKETSSLLPPKAPEITKKETPPLPGANEEQLYYSIILKDCPRRESLGRKLERIFIRDSFAIKLALDNMPSVIVYKSKVANIASVLAAFYLENAAISVIVGDFNLYATVYEQYSILHKQPADIQNMLYCAPSQLWLGDKIHIAAHARMQNRTGVLAVTDQGLYFLDNPNDSNICRWFILPYYRVLEISHFEDEKGCGLLVCYQGEHGEPAAGHEYQKFYIVDESQVKKALNLALVSLEEGHYRWNILLCCQKCNFRQTKILGCNFDDACPKCGELLEPSVLLRSKM